MQIGDEIQNTIEYLGRRGVKSLLTPTFVFVDELCPYNPGFYARLNQNLKKILTKGVDEQLREIYGEQNMQKLEKKISELKLPKEVYTEDIIFYQPFKNIDPGFRKSVIVEEVWHFVEAEKNVCCKLICEGTAKYGAYFNTGIEISGNRLSCFDIVKREMEKNHVNVFKAMLDPNVRKRIEDKFVQKLKKEGIGMLLESADELLRFSSF